MYWVEVDGRVMPRLLGGHSALDLCNTLAGWGGPPLPRGDWLPDADAMLVWFGHAGLLPGELIARLREQAAARPGKARSALEGVRKVRGDLYASLVQRDRAAYELVAATAHRSAAAARLERQPDGSARWVLPPGLGLDLPVLAAGKAAADLLVDQPLDQVRVCPGDECGWLFLDLRGTRRWCSMQTCGNKAKTRAFLARRRTGTGAG